MIGLHDRVVMKIAYRPLFSSELYY